MPSGAGPQQPKRRKGRGRNSADAERICVPHEPWEPGGACSVSVLRTTGRRFGAGEERVGAPGPGRATRGDASEQPSVGARVLAGRWPENACPEARISSRWRGAQAGGGWRNERQETHTAGRRLRPVTGRQKTSASPRLGWRRPGSSSRWLSRVSENGWRLARVEGGDFRQRRGCRHRVTLDARAAGEPGFGRTVSSTCRCEASRLAARR